MDVVSKLRNKDEDALQLLMEQYSQYLLQTAYLLVKDGQLAEEMVQDTFVIAYEKITQLQDSSKLKSWLTTIVINQCRAKMRTWSWRNIFLTKHMELEVEFGTEQREQSPEQLLLQGDRDKQLYTAIQELDYKYREAIILFYFNEMSIEEIAQTTAVKSNTVKTRLARGRQQLSRLLREEDHNE